MSNGYLVAAAADLGAAHEIAEGFGLDVIDASAVHDRQTTSAALAGAANVGLLLSAEAAHDEAFTALLAVLVAQLPRAQLIVVTPEARALFANVPDAWPVMSLDDARTRAGALARQRQPQDQTQAAEPPHAAPLPPTEPAPPEQPEVNAEAPAEHQPTEPENEAPPQADAGGVNEPSAESEHAAGGESLASVEDDLLGGRDEANAEEPQQAQEPAEAIEPEPAPALKREEEEAPVEAAPPPAARAPEPPPQAEPPPVEQQAPPQPAPAAQSPVQTERARKNSFDDAVDMHSSTRNTLPAERLGETAPADATAFAPSKFRRGTPELVRIVVHQPKDLNAVIKAAKKIDPRTEAAPQGMGIGNIAIGASIGVALEVRGASCEGTLQRRQWLGDPIDFNFAVEAGEGVKQVVMLARVFVDDAQIGVLAFTRKVSGPAKKPHGQGDRARLKRHKRVFLSYSSHDRETVSQIATAYQMAGVEHFWDRASLKSGEEWSPRLRREIDRADLFHLCWSKSAAQSEWVAKEAEHALTRRRKHSGKPEITVQMLDGPPWAPHPAELDSINFDDFVRAAIVGYARGDGS